MFEVVEERDQGQDVVLVCGYVIAVADRLPPAEWSLPSTCQFIIFSFSLCLLRPGMHILPPTLVLLSLIQHGFAGMNKAGDPCSVANNRLQEGTFQFWSECTSSNYCDETENICKPKRCRRDDFPFGYEKGGHLPDKCKKGQFCPDEGTDCQDILAVGSPCQLNRDGEGKQDT